MLKRKGVTPTDRAPDRFVAAEGVVATEQADTTILLNLQSGRYYTLNTVGGLIWSVLAGGASIDDLTLRVKKEFDAPEEQVRSDVEELVTNLLSVTLIRRER